MDMPLQSLIPFPANPFSPYRGQRLADLVESIKENGVLVPIILRPAGDAGSSDVDGNSGGGAQPNDAEPKYEILSGHNRVEAAKAAGIDTIPAVVREGLSDEEALLVVTETNLIQRSFADFSHSERAFTLSIHHEAIKSQGRRSDLIREVEELLQGDVVNISTTSDLVGQKLESRKQLGTNYGLAGSTVARYLRVNTLIKQHKDRLDTGALALYTAVSLSYLSESEQELVGEVLATERHRLSLAEADALRAAEKPLSREAVLDIVKDRRRGKRSAAPFILAPELLLQYFAPEQEKDEIEDIIAKALAMYFAERGV
jgi:ParB family chromosome partitioning protein